jgi:hypothetical protein
LTGWQFRLYSAHFPPEGGTSTPQHDGPRTATASWRHLTALLLQSPDLALASLDEKSSSFDNFCEKIDFDLEMTLRIG